MARSWRATDLAVMPPPFQKSSPMTSNIVMTLSPFSSARKPLVSSPQRRSEEHTSELQSLMRISYAVFCMKKKRQPYTNDNLRNYQSIHTNNTTNTQLEM